MSGGTSAWASTSAPSNTVTVIAAGAVPQLVSATLQRSVSWAAACGVSLLLSVGLLGLMLEPAWALLWVACFGFGSGACLILSLSFMGLRTHGPAQAAALSGMAQSVGYLLAAAGPPLVGLLRDLSGGWHLPLAVCLVLTLVIAGNERVIRPRLSDAAFFFEQDRKQPLAARRDALRAVTYQAELGSVFDKTERLARLAPAKVRVGTPIHRP